MAKKMTNCRPRFNYLFSSPEGDIIPGKEMLSASLPLHLSDVNGKGRGVSQISLSYRDYFELITSFLSRDSYCGLLKAMDRRTGRKVKLSDIAEITIHTEKHGAMYHIASVQVSMAKESIKFVLTTALSELGKSCLAADFHWLNYLNGKFPFSYLAQVYSKEETRYCGSNGAEYFPLLMLGEWLGGYHEFHLTFDSATQRQKIILWDYNKGNRYLTNTESYALYQEASKMLTLYYDTDTCEQVSAWHHAAGDFIVRADEDGLQLKLATVRRYAPLIQSSPDEKGNKIAALLHFFLHLSIRMRLDRLDGVGDVAWADDLCLTAMLKGFYEALEIKEETGHLSSSDKKDCLDCLNQFTLDDWIAMTHAVLETCPQPPADVPVMERHLDDHLLRLHEVIQHLPAGCTHKKKAQTS